MISISDETSSLTIHGLATPKKNWIQFFKPTKPRMHKEQTLSHNFDSKSIAANRDQPNHRNSCTKNFPNIPQKNSPPASRVDRPDHQNGDRRVKVQSSKWCFVRNTKDSRELVDSIVAANRLTRRADITFAEFVKILDSSGILKANGRFRCKDTRRRLGFTETRRISRRRRRGWRWCWGR